MIAAVRPDHSFDLKSPRRGPSQERSSCLALKKMDGESRGAAPRNAAEQSLLDFDFSPKAVLRSLEQTDIPLSDKRKNVLPFGVESVRGFTLGLMSWGVTAATRENRALT